MATRKEQAIVDLVINGRQAETSIKGIQKAVFETEKLLRNMTEAANPEEMAKYKKELSQLKSVQTAFNEELRLSESAWAKFKMGKASLHEINNEIKLLEYRLSKLNESDDIDLFDGLRQNLIELRKAKVTIEDSLKIPPVVVSSWSKFKSTVAQIAVGTLGGNVFTAIGTIITGALPKAIEKVTDFADAVSNVQKTTRLAKGDVEGLFDDLKDIDTRSKTAELRDLAAQAGKLGEDTEKGVAGFVRGADVINVALKEDLGGSADAAINKVGKLITIFDLKRKFGIEDSFIKVGSVINELGGNSAASEEYIVDFTTRLAGIAPAAKISIAEVMGLGAVMDEQGQSTELAATNIGKMLVSLGKDIPYFSKVAGMSVKEFTILLNTNANEALLRVVERAKQSEGGLGNLAKTFKTLGIDGTEGAAVIGALANNIGRVREQQAVANQEFANGTSILNEYNIKNNNSAAIWEKVTRKVESFFSGAFKPLGEYIIEISGRMFGVTSEFDRLSEKFQNQKEKVNGLEKSLVPLLAKYDNLVLRAAQGEKVQGELNTVVQQVANIMPSAVTAWDKYGNAIDINNAKARAAIKDHQSMLQYLNKENIDALEKRKSENTKAYLATVAELNKPTTIRQLSAGNAFSAAINIEVAKTDKEIQQQRKNLENLKKERVELNRTLNGFYGEQRYYTGPQKEIKPNSPTLPPAIGGTFEGVGKTEKPAKKEVDEFKQLKEEIRKLREDAVIDLMTENEKEVQVMKFKYDRLREMAKGNTDYILELNQLEDDELLRIRADQATKQQEQRQKSNEAYAKELEDAEKKSTELAQKRSETLQALDEYAATEQQRELGAVDRRFQTLLAQAEEVNLTAQETLPLWEAYWASRAAIEDKYYTEATDKSNKKRLQEIEAQAKMMSNVGDIFASFFEIAASNETEFAEFKKIATVVQMGADTASAISTMVSKGALSSATPLDAALKITAGIAVVMANIAKAKQILSKSEDLKKPNIQRMPGRETGGFTDLNSLYVDSSGDPAGRITKPTLFNLGARSWMGGEKGKQEYVFSYAMLQNPVMANFAAMSEALRTSGYDFSKRADMQPAQETGRPSADLEGLLNVLIIETRLNTAAVQKFANKPWNYRRVEQTAELLDYIRNDTKA